MQWLNYEVSVLQSAPVRRATPEQRGVWLTLSTYCAVQENGGRIDGTAHWGDWDWITVIGVEKKHVEGDSTLWHWEDGHVLVIELYPVRKERQVRRNRQNGRRGGSKTSAAKVAAAQANGRKRSTTQAPTEAEPKHNPSNNPTERNRNRNRNRNRKGIGKEGEQAGVCRPAEAPTIEAWLSHVADVHPEWPEHDARAAWAHYEAAGWILGRGKPVRSWRACVETCFARWQGARGKSSRGAETAALPFDPGRTHAHTGGLPDVTAAAPAGEPLVPAEGSAP